MILTPDEIGYLILTSGGFGVTAGATLSPFATNKDLDTAIAVALAESGGNTAARNPGSSARGLWQVMESVHKDKVAAAVKDAKPLFKPEFENLDNPVINTAVARKIYSDAGGWRPWEVYNNGDYRKHLGHAASAIAFYKDQTKRHAFARKLATTYYNPAFAGEAQGLNTPLEAVTKDPSSFLSGAFGGMIDFARQAGITVAIFLVGLVVLVLGIWFLVSSTKVTNLTPVGAVKKAVKK